MASTRQTSFAAGELSPLLWGRTDLELYAHGLRSCRNFYISPQGAAVSRPGTRFVAEIPTQARLIPFTISADQHAVLAIGPDGRVRIFEDGEQKTSFLVPELGGENLWRARYTQSGDVLFITPSSGSFPLLFRRNSATSWSRTAQTWPAIQPPARTGNFIWPVWIDRDIPSMPPGFIPYRKWEYQVGYVFRGPDGEVFETAPLRLFENVAAHPEKVADLADDRRKILKDELRIVPNWPSQIYVCLESNVFDADKHLEEVRIYRGRGGVFGLIGVVKPPATFLRGVVWEDTGDDPDTTRPPPQFRSPFRTPDPSEDGGIRISFPLTVAFHEQRLVFGGSTEDPTKLWFSAIDDYFNFDEVKPEPPATGSFEIELPARSRETIRALLPFFDQLLVFTDTSVWTVSGAEGPLMAGSIAQVRRLVDTGMAQLEPLQIDGTVMWVKPRGNGVNQLQFSQERQGAVAEERSTMAEHLAKGIVDWAYDDEHGIVWAVRSDGVLLSVTVRNGMNAWARHDTEGVFESVCVAGDGTTYFVVRRGSRRFLEKLSEGSDSLALDAAVTRFGNSYTINGLGHLEGRTVYATVDRMVQGPFVVSGGKVTVAKPPDGKLAHTIAVGLKFVPEIETLDVAMERDRMKVLRKLIWEVDNTTGLSTGETFDKLRKHNPRMDEHFASRQETGRVELAVFSSWNKAGRAVLRQEDPLPVTVLGVTREGDISRG